VLEPKERILKALAESGEAMRMGEIAAASGVSKQLVSYWIPTLIANGLVLPVRRLTVTKYEIQPALCEYNLTPRKLKELMAPFLDEVDFTHVEDTDNAILNLVHTCVLINSDGFWEDEDGGEEDSDGDGDGDGDGEK